MEHTAEEHLLNIGVFYSLIFHKTEIRSFTNRRDIRSGVLSGEPREV